jgi:hypothetical protein
MSISSAFVTCRLVPDAQAAKELAALTKRSPKWRPALVSAQGSAHNIHSEHIRFVCVCVCVCV